MKLKTIAGIFIAAAVLSSCKKDETEKKQTAVNQDFDYVAEQFADIKVLRYQIPGWDNLTLKEKELVYYLTQAGTAGRDIYMRGG